MCKKHQIFKQSEYWKKLILQHGQTKRKQQKFSIDADKIKLELLYKFKPKKFFPSN